MIGAINGWAVGGGFEWAINCDFPIWAESARAFFPELKWGMFVTGGVSSLLPALAGLQTAREMMFLGERYDAKALLEKGVAWRVVPDAEAKGIVGVFAQPTSKAKCVRCWHRREDVGADPRHAELCGRCVGNIEGEGEDRVWF